MLRSGSRVGPTAVQSPFASALLDLGLATPPCGPMRACLRAHAAFLGGRPPVPFPVPPHTHKDGHVFKKWEIVSVDEDAETQEPSPRCGGVNGAAATWRGPIKRNRQMQVCS